MGQRFNGGPSTIQWSRFGDGNGSTAYGAYQANNAAAKSLKGLKKQQDKIREMIDAETVESGTMKLNGKIYTGINSSDMSDMDYHSADSYFLNAPGFTTQLILLEPNESFGNRFFPTTFQSNIPRIDWGTSDIKDMYDAEYQYDYNEALVTVTENNMIGLIDTVGDDFDGYLFIDSQGRRYLSIPQSNGLRRSISRICLDLFRLSSRILYPTRAPLALFLGVTIIPVASLIACGFERP